MSKSKKKTGAAVGIAAIFAAATLALFGISGNTVVEVDYILKNGDSLSELSIYPPENIGVDIVELYCNDNIVTKTVLPNGTLKSIPFVFSNLENLELRLYKLNEVVGIGNFKDDKLYVAFKDDAMNNDEENSNPNEEITEEAEHRKFPLNTKLPDSPETEEVTKNEED